VSDRRALLVTGADLAPQALELLKDFEVVYAGKTPQEADLVALCRKHDPVAIIVRYGKVGAAVMDAAPSLRVISKHGSGTDTIDKDAAKARGIEVRAAAGANAAAVAEQALALLLACAKSVVQLNARMHARPLGQGHAQERGTARPHHRPGGPGRHRPALRAHVRCDGHEGDRLRPLREGPAGLHPAGGPGDDLARVRCHLAALPADGREPGDAGRVRPWRHASVA
jgi:lactate dehydrogenase-like 2-hydroxyacid dehydrogenase